MKKAIVYIDGYNLYFGLLKDTCWKWLDLWKFAECLLDGRYGKTVVVFNPHASGGKHLKRAATFFKYIPRDLPAKCQLPEVVPVGTRGNVIRRPMAWL